MIIAKAIKLLREFPKTVFSEVIDEAGAVTLPVSDTNDISRILYRLGYKDMEKGIESLKEYILEYLTEIALTAQQMPQTEGTGEGKADPVSDYVMLIRIIKKLAELGNYDLNILTIFDAHFIIQEPLNVELLHKQVLEKIEKAGDKKAQYQMIYEHWTEQDKQNPEILNAFLKEI